MAVSVVSTAESSVATAGTSHLVSLPASIAAGDMVLITMDIGSTSATLNALTGWEEILDEANANGLKILRYTGAGVPTNPTFTSSAATRSASIAWRITGADKTITPQIGTTAAATSTNPDPPASANPPSTKEYLFITFFGQAGESVDDDLWCTNPPTNYSPTPPLQKACGTAGSSLGGIIAAASRVLSTGTAENPGAFTQATNRAWRAQTITVHPATWSDSRTGIIVPQGTKTESKAGSEARSGQIVVAGTRTESWAVGGPTYTDTPRGTVSLWDSRYWGRVLQRRPSLYWPLDAASGITDQSGHSQNGSGQGGISVGGFRSSPIANEALSTDFSGSGQGVTSSYNPFVNGTVRTFAGWAYRDVDTGNHALFGASGDAGTYIRCSSGGNDVLMVVNGSFVFQQPYWPGNAQWVHWAWVMDEAGGAACRFYINGIDQLGGFDVPSWPASPGNLQLGIRGGPQDYWDGKMAHFVVFERVLSPDEITELANSAPSNATSDSFSHTASPSGLVVVGGTRTESKSAFDTRSGAVVISGTRIESKAHSSTVTGTVVISGTWTENRSATETRSGTVVLSGTRSESLSRSSSPAGVVVIRGTRTESFIGPTVYTDSPSGAVIASGTRTESFAATYNDSPSGRVVVSGTRSESFIGPTVYTDSQTGSVVPSGSRAESTSRSVSPTGTLVIRGSCAESYLAPIDYTDATTGFVVIDGVVQELYVPSGASFDFPGGVIVLSGSVRELHSRWDNLGGERWPGDTDGRWPGDTGERWDHDSDSRWGTDTPERWEVDPVA